MTDYSRTYNRTVMWEIVPEHLEAAMLRAGVNQSQLAELVGVKQPSIGRLLSGETKTTRALDLIAQVLDTSPAYLKGETDNPIRHAGAADVRVAFRGPAVERDPDMVQLQELDLAFGMGGTFLDTPARAQARSFSREWLRNFTTASPKDLFFARGVGDSMMPTILDSDIVLIDRSQVTPMMGDQIWAVAFGQIGMIKRLRPMPDGSVKILSDNPSVPPETATDGELHVLGRVVTIMRKC